MVKDTKLWFEGQKTYHIIFTEGDLMDTLKLLEKNSGGFNPDDWNEFDRIKSRILIQMK